MFHVETLADWRQNVRDRRNLEEDVTNRGGSTIYNHERWRDRDREQERELPVWSPKPKAIVLLTGIGLLAFTGLAAAVEGPGEDPAAELPPPPRARSPPVDRGARSPDETPARAGAPRRGLPGAGADPGRD